MSSVSGQRMAFMRASSARFGVLLVALLALASSGCSIAANMAYWWGGNLIPARSKALEGGKRVAVVCLDSNSLGGPGGEAEAVARAVAVALVQARSKILVVR